MKAGDLMTTGAATTRPDASLAEALQTMLAYHISGLPVVDGDGRLVGVVSERDFLRGRDGRRPRWLDLLREEGTGPAALSDPRVGEVMTPEPVSIGEESSLDEIMQLMERHGVKRLPVVTAGKVVGIVSRADLLRALARKAGRPAAEA